MHGCRPRRAHGHAPVGAARLLADERRRGAAAAGSVLLLFEPSEGTSRTTGTRVGAVRMIEDGALDTSTPCLACTSAHALFHGKLFVREGAVMAGSDTFRLTVRGRSARAGGAQRRRGRHRRGFAPGAGRADGRVPPHLAPRRGRAHSARCAAAAPATCWPTRSWSRAPCDTSTSMSAVCSRKPSPGRPTWPDAGRIRQLDYRAGYPPLVNPPDMVRLAREAAREELGDDAAGKRRRSWAPRTSRSCSRSTRRVLWLGGALERPREHHHPEFNVDEQSVRQGAAVLAACALKALANGARWCAGLSAVPDGTKGATPKD